MRKTGVKNHKKFDKLQVLINSLINNIFVAIDREIDRQMSDKLGKRQEIGISS